MLAAITPPVLFTLLTVSFDVLDVVDTEFVSDADLEFLLADIPVPDKSFPANPLNPFCFPPPADESLIPASANGSEIRAVWSTTRLFEVCSEDPFELEDVNEASDIDKGCDGNDVEWVGELEEGEDGGGWVGGIWLPLAVPALVFAYGLSRTPACSRFSLLRDE